MAGAATGGQTATPNANLPPGMTGPQFSVGMNDMSNTGMVQPGTQTTTMADGSTITPQGMAPAPVVPVDPMQQASLAQQGALAGTALAGTTNIGTIAGTDLNQYMNPFTQQVINRTQADIMQGAQKGVNALDYAAGKAGAFGGSRHGVAMGEFGTGVAKTMADTSADLRMQGFNQAQNMAQSDIGNRLSQANLGLNAAQQLSGLGQTSFDYGTQIADSLAQQGASEQALVQALIDAAKGQYAGYTGAPQEGLSYVTQALGATATPTTTTQTKQPGLFDYLTLAATAAS